MTSPFVGETDARLAHLVARFERCLAGAADPSAPVFVGSRRAGGHWVPLARADGRAIWAVVDRMGAVTALIAAPPDEPVGVPSPPEAAQMTTAWQDS